MSVGGQEVLRKMSIGPAGASRECHGLPWGFPG